MQNLDIRTISSIDCAWPQEFNYIQPEVKVLYGAGNVSLLAKKPRLGIVGSRKMTPYGREVTSEMARTAAKAGITVVSGLAFGVDSTAHRAVLEVGGDTIAVIPSSLQKIYPSSHNGLAKQIVEQNGLLISEYDKIFQSMKHTFIERNRIIAALSDVLLVTEAGEKSGSLSTADFAAGLGKILAVVPGNITSPTSQGTNQLIKDGKGESSVAVLSSTDLLSLFGFNENLMKHEYKPENTYEKVIFDTLKEGPHTLSVLLERTKLDAQTLNIHLTLLELKGVISSPGASTWKIN